MRRLGKMIHISQVAENISAKDVAKPEIQFALSIRVRQILGPMISKQIRKVALNKGALTLHVADPTWRNQLSRDAPKLRARLTDSLPQIHHLIFKA